MSKTEEGQKFSVASFLFNLFIGEDLVSLAVWFYGLVVLTVIYWVIKCVLIVILFLFGLQLPDYPDMTAVDALRIKIEKMDTNKRMEDMQQEAGHCGEVYQKTQCLIDVEWRVQQLADAVRLIKTANAYEDGSGCVPEGKIRWQDRWKKPALNCSVLAHEAREEALERLNQKQKWAR